MTNTTQPIFLVSSSELKQLPNNKTLSQSNYLRYRNTSKPLTRKQETSAEVDNLKSHQVPSKVKKISLEEKDEIQSKKPMRDGRWTKDECRRFEEALKKFGKHWKKVEAYVGTRSSTQVRSHAQKYFLKIKTKENTTSVAQEADSSAAHTTFVPLTQEKNEPDMNTEEKKEVTHNENSSSLTSSYPKQDILQSAFGPFNREVNPMELFKRSNVPVLLECRYLQEHIKKFGYWSVEEIYAKCTRLSDWVDTML